jgi:hypothetical protein
LEVILTPRISEASSGEMDDTYCQQEDEYLHNDENDEKESRGRLMGDRLTFQMLHAQLSPSKFKPDSQILT